MLSTRDAALLAGVSISTIRTWVNRGILTPALRVDGKTWFRVADVDRAEHTARQRDVTGRALRRVT